MLRLTRAPTPTAGPDSPSGVLLKAEGQIVAEWVSLLEKECRELLSGDQAVILDLGSVSYLDRRAIRIIRELTRGSLSVVNCPPLVEELLNEDSAE